MRLIRHQPYQKTVRSLPKNLSSILGMYDWGAVSAGLRWENTKMGLGRVGLNPVWGNKSRHRTGKCKWSSKLLKRMLTPGMLGWLDVSLLPGVSMRQWLEAQLGETKVAEAISQFNQTQLELSFSSRDEETSKKVKGSELDTNEAAIVQTWVGSHVGTAGVLGSVKKNRL